MPITQYKTLAKPTKLCPHTLNYLRTSNLKLRENHGQGRRMSPFLALDLPRFFLVPGAQVTSVVRELSELCSDPEGKR